MSILNKSEPSSDSISRLSRWFSMRRGSHSNYDLITTTSTNSARCGGNGKNDEDGLHSTITLLEKPGNTLSKSKDEYNSGSRTKFQNFPLYLSPAPPDGLNPSDHKKRYIVSAILQSENSYISSMQRLVNDYKKTLEESNPSILNSSKITTLFHCIPDILHCHLGLRITLSDYIRNWDNEGKIGEAFLTTFSETKVLEAYSGFINNFTNAMDLVKTETKRKSAFADFLTVKLITSHDRLSFFALMVKPVQRIPQFILFLHDLLKHTPSNHEDRISLQMALTQMENLADSLNEGKRKSEQYQAYKVMLHRISAPFSSRFISSRLNYLVREDNVIEMEFNHEGQLQKSKSRRLFLANDKLICVSVAPKQSHDFGSTEKLTLKWNHHLSDIEMVDNSKKKFNRFATSGTSTIAPIDQAEQEMLANELSNLMYDYNIMSRINDLAAQLKGNYVDINLNTTKKALKSIQRSIMQKDEEIAWVDSCCLQMILKNKTGKEEVFVFRTESPEIKREWVNEFRLAQLALNPNNSPAWESFDPEKFRSSLPLFLEMQSIYKPHKTQLQTEICGGCYYSVSMDSRSLKRSTPNRHYIWICVSDGSDSHIRILQHHPYKSKSLIDNVSSLQLPKTIIKAIEHTKGRLQGSEQRDYIWCGMSDKRIIIFDATKVENPREVRNVPLPDVPTKILFHFNSENVFVSLKSGELMIFNKESDQWTFEERNEKVSLNTQKEISNMQSINNSVYVSSGNNIFVIDGHTGNITKKKKVCDFNEEVNIMQHTGVGIWISLKRSSIIKLYHAETFKHLQDLNIGPHILRLTSSSTSSNSSANAAKSPSIFVTALQACKGLLWVGTNTGISCTIPLPRVDGGYPLISETVNISYHAHCGPVTFFLPLLSRPDGNGIQTSSTKTEPKKELLETNTFSNVKSNDNIPHNPIVLRKKSCCKNNDSPNDSIRKCKTLPRGFSGISSQLMRSSSSSGSSQNGYDVGFELFGMYSDLLNIKDDSFCGNNTTTSNNKRNSGTILNSFRRVSSDPDLADISFKVGTLDRRMKMKIGRPRSLDLSDWSVSRSSSVYSSSSESEGSMEAKFRSLSRNSSSASHKFDGGNLCEIKEIDAMNLTSTSQISENLSTNLTEKSLTMEEGSSSSIRNKRSTDLIKNIRNSSILMLMGGRGYVNWKNVFNSHSNSNQRGNNFADVILKHSRSNSLTVNTYKLLNSTDGNIIIWEKKI